jgi:hypothetical protein
MEAAPMETDKRKMLATFPFRLVQGATAILHPFSGRKLRLEDSSKGSRSAIHRHGSLSIANALPVLVVGVSFLSFDTFLSAGQEPRRHVRTTLADENPPAIPPENPEGIDPAIAQRMLESLQRARTEPDIIPPASALTTPRASTRKPLWTEGPAVVERAGTLTHEGGWWMLRWADATSDPPVKLLPNLSLEQMIRAAEGSDDPVRFSVSGEMTVYQSQNFLLPTFATRISSPVPLPPTESPDVSTPESPSPVDDVISAMKAQIVPRSLASPDENARRGPARRESVLWASIADGTPLVNRPGRVVQTGQWWTIIFESDNADRPEPPLRVLPNRVLEGMVRTSERGAAGLVFLVSGEITAFQGENYLLARVAVRLVDLGNLSK